MHDEKVAALSQRLQDLINRFPKAIDLSILKERDRLLSFFDHEFLRKRSVTQLVRILSSMHITKKKLLRILPHSSKTRCVEIHFIPAKLHYPFVSKWVVGILVQVSMNNRHELFDHEQLLKAVQKLVPQLRIVKGSVYSFQGPDDNLKTLYAEFEKTGNQYFTLSELKKLKTKLAEEITLRVERLVPSVFMTRNQEEVLRNILTLSQQIEYSSDLPQVMISFERQTPEEFVFNAICVRVEDHNAPPLENIVQLRTAHCVWVLERKQLVKYLNDHHPIFAHIYRVILAPHSSILRSDGSLNFFAARHKIVNLLKEFIGDYRDFNGGILIKQEETLLAICKAFPEIPLELIENFYYSITPIEMQAILSIQSLNSLFQMFLHILESPFPTPAQHLVRAEKKNDLHFIVIRVANGDYFELAKEHLSSFDFPEAVQASFSVAVKNSHIFGYVIETEDTDLESRFLDSLQKLLHYWDEEVQKQQVLRLSLENPVSSLDPRIGGDAVSAIILKMLFEGLMRIGPDGNLELAIAQEIEISPDKKTYLFHLRPSVWSDGTPLTSYDFEYAWKKILSPRFNTAFAFFFDVIKNAKLAKKGALPMNQVGIQALDDHTLKVELEFVSPNFLEFMALPYFSPICRHVDINEPNWPNEEGERYICNGAFTIHKNHKDNYIFVKNPHYWDREKIRLDKVLLTTSHHSQTYEIFSENKIHWLGAPLGSWGNNFKPGPADEAMTHQDNGLYRCTCNTRHPLLKNSKIRLALSLAVDREELLRTIQYYNSPAYSPLPLCHSNFQSKPPIYETDLMKRLFLEGLEETGYSLSQIPSISITYTALSAYGKMMAEFLKQQWKDRLGLNITTEGYDYKILFSRLTSSDFDLAISRWQPWVNDPFYTLNCLFDPEDPLNYSKWSHPIYQELLKQAHQEVDDEKRHQLLIRLEELLIEEMPIIPLFHTYFQSIKKRALILKPNHTLLDFKWAHFE